MPVVICLLLPLNREVALVSIIEDKPCRVTVSFKQLGETKNPMQQSEEGLHMRVAATSPCAMVDLGPAPADKEILTVDSKRQMVLVGVAFMKEATPTLCSVSQAKSKAKGASFPRRVYGR